MYLFHNSHDEKFRRPFGAAEISSEIFLALEADSPEPGFSCILRLWSQEDGERLIPMETRDGSYFYARFSAPDTGCLLWYSFIAKAPDGETLYYGNNEKRLGGIGSVWDSEPPSYQITVYKPSVTPEWYKSSIVYQIFPDRFRRGSDWEQCQKNAARPQGWKGPRRVVHQDWDDTPCYTKDPQGNVTRWPFFGGNLQGIIEKLQYLKSLGVGVIYLNPIFTAASNHKYDTADYMSVDPSFGGDGAFSRLCREAEKLGISVILDGVFSHTGADSVYFDKYGNYGSGACSSPDSEYRDWYVFQEYPAKYQCWWGVDDLPNVREMTPSYREFIYGGENSVIRKWLRMGARGWRLDVADELPDEFIAGVKKALRDEKKDGLLMGEVWEDASNKESYGVMRRYFLGDELDCTMHYPFRTAMTDFMLGRRSADDVAELMYSLSENYPKENFYGALNLIGTHDSVRIMTLMGDAPEDLPDSRREFFRLSENKYGLAKARLKLLSLLQYAFPGVPCIYYGDEAGMQGYPDPYNRGTYPWGREDRELLEHYRRLAEIYSEHPALKTGSFTPAAFGEDVCGCIRAGDGETLIALVNRDVFNSHTALLPASGWALELLSSREYTLEDGKISVQLAPLQGALLCIRPKAPDFPDLPRCSGILCHVSSLPSGKLDGDAERFIDFLSTAGQKLWQILPLNPVGKGASPYWSPGVFAGNTELYKASRVSQQELSDFRRENSYWLPDYALYQAISEKFGPNWPDWPAKYRDRRDLPELFREFAPQVAEIEKNQCAFWLRWEQVLEYAHKKGVKIIGDVPIYVAPESADTWAHRELFILSPEGRVTMRAGVPPDYFSPEGQDWGNPLYDWRAMEEDGFAWWIQRLRLSLRRFDYIRLDHFRSFSAYYAIPENASAKDGLWMPGIGGRLFKAAEKAIGPLPVIAEDLGVLDAGVYNLIKLLGYPGMNVWQFSSEEMSHMPPELSKRRLFFTGTHDNETLAGWCGSAEKAREALEKLWSTSCPWVIAQLQDVLLLDNSARLNVPGTPDGNWKWRVKWEQLTEEQAAGLRSLTKRYERM